MNTYLPQVNASQNMVNLESLMSSISQLDKDSDSFQKTYTSGKPYPHLVIDDLFDSEVLDRIISEFPKSEHRNWIAWDSDRECKTTSKGIAGLPSFTQLFCLWLNSAEFIEQLKRITGIKDLVPDPLFFGAGLHEMFRGGWLDVHADYTKHPTLPLIRRINLLIYLNREWNPAWGGDIELWDQTNQKNRVAYPAFLTN
jgi:hypothetical protein